MDPTGFDPRTGAYVDTRVTRGFPLGGIGAGGFSFNTDGSFGEFRWNNNWMCPVRTVRGCFHALFVRRGEERRTVVLRRAGGFGDDGPEYENARPVRSTSFVGLLPAFTLAYADPDLPVRVRLAGFTPHVPHALRDSILPAAVFRFRIENPAPAPVEVAVLFALENVLGRGGTGHRGVVLGPEGELRAVRPRIVYDSAAGNHQAAAAVGGARGVRFGTAQRWDPRAHRCGVTGEYLLLAAADPDLDVTVCDGWDAGAVRAAVLDDFARNGRLRSRASGRPAAAGDRPAAAVAAAAPLDAGAAREIVFVLAWWTPDHVTEPGLACDGDPGAAPDGVRAGHVYETHFGSIDAVAAHVLDRRAPLEVASGEVPRLLDDSSLPPWLVRAIANSIDAVLCNTVVPASGRLYTLEGVDWHWPMGGLTGTADQRLAGHAYVATFFPELDLTELDEFRRLADSRGAVPHGNGNCDLGLGTTDVPYGWPLVIRDFLPAKEWTDLTMSLVLQVALHWRRTARRDVLERFWPALVRGVEYLHGLAPRGVPEGGTTYDVWDFPGAFGYTATLYLATLAAMGDLAAAAEPARAAVYRARAAACARRLDDDLWDPRGFYRAAEGRDTIFGATLAGDWAARHAGLDPVVDPARAASHLRHQHRVLVEEAARAAAGRYRALPRAEARPDGTPVIHRLGAGLPAGEEMTYVWQVLAYQGMEQIYLGQVAEGLATIAAVYDRLWHDGNAWSGGLRGNGESIYMTHPVIWAVLHALTGAALDLPRRMLHLAPRTGGGIERLRCPVFFPGFWALLDHDAGGTTHLEVLRHVGEPATITRVQHRDTAGRVRVLDVGPVRLAAGARLDLVLDGGGL